MRFFPVFILAIFCLTACSEKQAPEKSIPEVFVVTVQEQPYRPSRGFNGRIRSSSDVDVMAQVSGELIAIHFKEGDRITAGTPLFDIDPAPYKAQLSQANAELSRALANEANARKNFERGKKLVADGFISQSEFDTLESRALEALASIKAAEAAVESAQVNLNFTTIKASQDGRVGRSAPAVGDVVGPQSGVLTTLVGEGGKDVVFQLPEKLLLGLRKKDRLITTDDVLVALELPDGSEYSETGRITYLSNRVDATTGTVETMASMPDPDDILRPGMFVKATLKLEQPLMGLMIPQASLQVDQQGTYVLAVDENNMVTRKNLIAGERVGENTLVNSGLDAGTRIIVRGVQKARVGDQVKAIPFEPATQAAEGDARDQ
ncbi:efflux RND transporter periplasmic adaptor subunit [Teredinibacter sp. KSP-S5-2]|uniref:efflux RND transporter periplasmic adaptor subunit n=1 Tax=Teredinibacter sp. KSP-S5-2 TaxID=3034506 RepID=UPI002934D2B1|nr:efflux RND transporter periplasmic adaptor subunit [Teredinibacter sp. KSP-S5-2]WNO08323.1 efflux RND transporter periplasmic adaptor subunit [Teredinibacter sp. KSP-S5-2]